MSILGVEFGLNLNPLPNNVWTQVPLGVPVWQEGNWPVNANALSFPQAGHYMIEAQFGYDVAMANITQDFAYRLNAGDRGYRTVSLNGGWPSRNWLFEPIEITGSETLDLVALQQSGSNKILLGTLIVTNVQGFAPVAPPGTSIGVQPNLKRRDRNPALAGVNSGAGLFIKRR